MNNVDKGVIKQYTQLLSATLLMIALQFAIAIILTRTMSPEDYGTYKLIINTNLLLQNCLTFGIPVTLSYLLTNEEANQRQYVGAGLKTAIASCAIGVAFCMILMVIQSNTNLYIVDNIALVFSPLCIIPVFVYYSEYICIGTNKISLLSKLKVFIQILLISALFVCWVVFSNIELWMVLCVYAMANIIIIIFIFKKIGTATKIDKGVFKKIFNTNKTVGFQAYIGSLFSVASTSIMVVLLDAYITKGEYAIYSLAITISAPLGPLISTLGSVMYKKFSKLKKMSNKFIIFIVLMTIGIAVIYFIVVKLFTTVLFGEYYRASINYACAIGAGSLLVGLGDVFNRFVLVKGKGKYIRNVSIMSGAINIGIAAALITSINTIGVTIARISSNVSYLVMIVIAYIMVSRQNEKSTEPKIEEKL